MKSMDKQLQHAWDARQAGVSVKSPEEALTLASIVEKETGKGADRPLISGVFNNRLRIGMRLQTDPTVIYGLGEAFDGNLRRVLDLRHALEHLHARRFATHAYCDARQSCFARRGATGQNAGPVLCGQGRWQQPLQRHAG